MDADEALGLIACEEGQTIEFKTSLAEENAAIRALGAFANSEGGTVFFGVKPDSSIVGVDVGANTLENFSNTLRRESEPPLSPTIDQLDIDGKTVVVVVVDALQPGHLVHVFNDALIRVGRTNQVMSPVEQRRRLLEGKETDVPSAVSTVFDELQSASYLIGNEAFSALEVFERVGMELLAGKDPFIFRAAVAKEFGLSPSDLVDERPILQHWVLNGIVDTPERVEPGQAAGPQTSTGSEKPYDRYTLSALGKKTLNQLRKRKAGTPAPPGIGWPKRAGAPRFRMSPGIDNGRLICDFKISDASPAPGGVEVRWQGAGTQMDWTEPGRGNVRSGDSSLKFQPKPTDMAPTPPADEVTLEVRFNLEDGPHGGRWTWPMRQHEKGHWILDSHLGSSVHQPRPEDAW